MSEGAAEGAAPDAPARRPRLFLDGAGAVVVLLALAVVSHAALTPDGVAYLENAELFAHGHWAQATQGYWSPGYSLLLVPAVWLAGADRERLLALAHIVQLLLGMWAIVLAADAVRRHVPAPAQRAVFWGCAWVLLRWVSQEFLTPDLLLCALTCLFLARWPARNARQQVALGVIAGAAMLVKSSIWPALFVLLALAAARAVRRRSWRFPAFAVCAGALTVAPYLLVLSVRAGHPTPGSVGRLNVEWYLGDLDRRSPDTDTGMHEAKRLLVPPGATPIAVFDLREGTRTYEPWSDPEAWARGVPRDARPRLSARQAAESWIENVVVVARWLLPVVVGLALCTWWTGAAGLAGDWRERLLGEPALVAGSVLAAQFLATHAEHRLLAPAALLWLLGTWPTGEGVPRRGMRWLTAALCLGVAVQLALYAVPVARVAFANDRSSAYLHAYLDAQRERTHKSGVVIVGPADIWMSVLWRHHLRVAGQVGREGRAALRALAEKARTQTLQDAFGATAFGVGEVVMRREAGQSRLEWNFSIW